MEFLSPAWFSALAAIVLIDLVLAGDNAIVIALAARSLPSHLQRKAIVWGTVGAIVVRAAMTLTVVWLLRIPGLMLVGGLALVWIAYKLLVPTQDGDKHATPVDSFWSAIGPYNARKTIDAGFTTVRNVGSPDFDDVGLQQAIQTRRIRATPRHVSDVDDLGCHVGHHGRKVGCISSIARQRSTVG